MNVLGTIYKIAFFRLTYSSLTKLSQVGVNVYINSYKATNDTPYSQEDELTSYFSLSLYNSSGSLLNKDVTIMILVQSNISISDLHIGVNLITNE